MALRVFGVDPGLTRCGVGIVDVAANRKASLVHVTVLRSSPEEALERRLLRVGRSLAELLDEYQPHVVAVERVFAQHNVSTVMGTAQISGVALHAAAERDIPVALHTPSEVKAAITGYGAADKRQVQNMVARVLGLTSVPRPADAADALALAVCHAWRRGAPTGDSDSPQEALTPAQRAWRAAERSTRVSDRAPRLRE